MREPEGDRLRGHIKEFEGWRSKVYRCPAGYLTIGWGRNLEGKGITKKEGSYLLEGDIAEKMAELERVADHYGVDLDRLSEDTRIALTDMTFNLGGGGVAKFQLMWAALAAGDLEEAGRQLMASRYAKQVRRRALRNRSLITGSS